MIFFLFIWALNSLGFFALASAMQKHQKQIFNQILSNTATRYYGLLGWLLLVLSLIICCFSGALSNMIAYWIASLSFAAMFVCLSLQYWAENIKKICVFLLCLALLTGIKLMI